MVSGKEVVVKFHCIAPQPRTVEDKSNVNEWQRKRNFYKCKSTKNHLGYMNSCSPDEDFDNNQRKEEQKPQKTKKDKTYLDYMGNKVKTLPKDEISSGLFDRTGMLSIDKIKCHRENLRETEGNIWFGVISFEEDYGKKHCSTSEQASKLMKNVFDKFLDSTHLDSKHIEWTAALHVNTDNRHIHFTFYEKEPYREMKNGELKYSYKANVPKSSLDYLKQSVFRYFAYSQVNVYEMRDKIIQSIKSDFKDMSVSGQLFQDFKELSVKLQAPQGIKYKELSDDQRRMIDTFSMNIIKSSDELTNIYTKTFDTLAKVEEDIIAYDNSINLNKSIISRTEFFRNDLLERMGRLILKNTEYVSQRYDFLNWKLNEIYANNLSEKARFTSVRMIKKGISKEVFRCFKKTVGECSGMVKNYRWLKILQDKENEDKAKNEKVY